MNTVTTESICNEIETLINCPKFRATCVEVAKKVGITAKEWNENKINILYMFATQVVCKG
jgi:hypothetical protein